MGAFARDKGQRGEREMCDLLKDAGFGSAISRNLEQVRNGGADIVCIEGLNIEVKRCQTFELKKWWAHLASNTVHNNFPVLCYRKNRQPWSFLVSLDFIMQKHSLDRQYDNTVTLKQALFFNLLHKNLNV